jgi:lysyl-tRNA synthetase class 2
MSLVQVINLALLKDRAEMLALSRTFFAKRNVLEVDCCSLSPCAAIDANIDVIDAQVSLTQKGYLHTSPEYAMKRLLAAGSGDIFYLGHVFRQGEIGRLHAPEFTMAEWYRLGVSFQQMIEETCQFIQLFLGALPTRVLSYRDAFEQYLSINYTDAPETDLLKLAKQLNFTPNSWSRSTLLHFLLTHVVEPKLGRDELTILTHYPPNEAALARVVQKNNEPVAERFEIYFRGVELCNGYHELPDGHELRRRFTAENLERAQAGKPSYPLDEPFLAALGPNFPDCCGVSVGIDRLLLLRHKKASLKEVLPFAWCE